MPLLRSVLLTVSRTPQIKKIMMAIPVTRHVVRRFVPGETLDEAIAAIRTLKGKGLKVTVDCLGEDTRDRAMADHMTEQYVELLERIAAEGLAADAEVSLKLSAVGQFLGAEGERIALANARRICAAARDIGTTVTLDMEDHTTTDSTLGILAQLREEFPSTGCVLQASLYRTENDARNLAVAGQRVRLCKGAYKEPDSDAYPVKADVDRAYVRDLRTLMEGEGYPMVASHDARLIAIAQDMAARLGRADSSWELQMLYGIRPLEQERLADLGHTVRVYLPYGTDWYGYFTRRLAERPANLLFFVRSLVARR